MGAMTVRFFGGPLDGAEIGIPITATTWPLEGGAYEPHPLDPSRWYWFRRKDGEA